MRKNGIDKKLTPIDGGVCAPDGFFAGGVRCGVAAENAPFYDKNREDIALILADKRVPTACVFARGKTVGAPVLVTKKHIQTGYARAVFINSGVANVQAEDGIKSAEAISRALERLTPASANEIVLASTGAITGKFPTDKILSGLENLTKALGKTEGNSLAAARAIMTSDTAAKQLAFSFRLGDYPCKIGAIFKGGKRVCPNMATTLCFLTTDVNIEPKMLQKALNAAVDDTWNMLDLDGVASPNDTVCIMASGGAGNYRIFTADTEYKKFADVLKEVMARVCQALLQMEGERPFVCRVSGAKSLTSARTIAKYVASAGATREMLLSKKADSDLFLSALYAVADGKDVAGAEIALVSSSGELLLVDEGKPVLYNERFAEQVLLGSAIEIRVRLHAGNYGAQAYGACGSRIARA